MRSLIDLYDTITVAQLVLLLAYPSPSTVVALSGCLHR